MKKTVKKIAFSYKGYYRFLCHMIECTGKDIPIFCGTFYKLEIIYCQNWPFRQ